MDYDFDPELAPWVPRIAPVDYSDMPAARTALQGITRRQPAYRPVEPIEVLDRSVPGPAGGSEVPVRVCRRRPEAAGPGPGLLYLHWGGFVFGDLDTIHPTAMRIADRTGAVVVSADYRLAPEHPFPAGLEDCYAALCWMEQHAQELGIDAERLAVGGESAGGGLAAALALLARDRGGPPLRLQCLMFPELDDRLDTVSARTFRDTPKWNRLNAQASWAFYLGPTVRPGSGEVSPYAAPARAEDLSGLPPAFVCVCEYDPGRDEDLTYAHRLIQAGVRTEIGYYPGTFHASLSITEASITQKMLADQIDALSRGLRRQEGTAQ